MNTLFRNDQPRLGDYLLLGVFAAAFLGMMSFIVTADSQPKPKSIPSITLSIP